MTAMMDRMESSVNPKAITWVRGAIREMQASDYERSLFCFYNTIIPALLRIKTALDYADVTVEDIKDYGPNAVAIVSAMRNCK